jgi:hypothetical protein
MSQVHDYLPPSDTLGSQVVSRHAASRWLLGLAICEFAGYTLLWLLLHAPNIVPPIGNGWFEPYLGYGASTGPQFLVRWLGTRPNVAGMLLLATFLWVWVVFVAAVTLTWYSRLQLSTRKLVVLTTLMALPLLGLPQLLSSDIYSYSIYGRIPVLYGGNPLVDLPADFPHDQILPRVAWKTTASVYGPAWIIVSIPVTILAELLGGSPGSYVLLYKLLALGCHLGSVVLIARLLGRIRPNAVTWGTLMYAWQPLILIEFAGSGHNDSLMLLLIFLALAAAVQQRRSVALGMLVVAGMVKLVAIFLVPLYALYVIWQILPSRRLQALTYQVVLGLSIVVGLYLPFWVGPITVTNLATSPPLAILHQSPASWVFTKLDALRCPGTEPPSEREQHATTSCSAGLAATVRMSSLLLFGITYLLLLGWPMHTLDSFIGRAVGVLTAYNVLAAVHYEPWYGTWVLGVAALLRRPRPLLLAWGCSLLVLYGTMPVRGRIMLAFAPLLVLGLDELRRIPWVQNVLNRNNART